MKYTKNDVIKLDVQTIDFCKRWIWDALRRRQLTEGTRRTKTQREFVKDTNTGLEMAFDELRRLEKYQTGAALIADEFNLLDDTIRE